ncbi:MAG: TonB-dependent receptor, partial [Sphingomonadales bacterium]|nr:TonB-dependent receptor [Sphingomonadales bacterium]
VADDQKIRLGVARTLARPNMSDMNANFSFGYDPTKADSTDVNNSPWGGGGGNPQLRPWMAWQFDASYENYFGDGAYVSVAGFYKKLTNYVHGGNVLADFSGIAIPDALPQPTLSEGLIGAPINGHGGKIYGAELSLSLPGAVISDMLDGFGLLFSSSFTDSSVRETKGAEKQQLQGLSKTVINTTIYYEKSGFEARVSSRYRSDFLGEVSGLSLNRTEVFIKAENVWDAQIGFDFAEFGMEGLSARLQVNNFTNKAFTTYQNGDQRQVRDFQNYGRTFLFGVMYKM